MSSDDKRVGFGAFPAALIGAMQWRLILVWILAMLVPACIAVLPVRNALAALFDHSVHSAAWAKGFEALPMSDALIHIATKQAIAVQTGSGLALVVTFLLAPFLTGMIVAVLRAQRRLGFGELIHGGIHEYGRMLRLALWALVPFAVAAIIAGAAFGISAKMAESAVLQASAERGSSIAFWIALVFFVLAHAVAESARSSVAADSGLRSMWRALGRGLRMVFTRPLATLGMYLGTSVIGYAIVLFLAMWRIHTPAIGIAGTLFAFLIAQAIVLVLAWQRIARLIGLAVVARTSRSGPTRRAAYASSYAAG